MGEACSTHVKELKYIQNFSRKPERDRPLGRQRIR